MLVRRTLAVGRGSGRRNDTQACHYCRSIRTRWCVWEAEESMICRVSWKWRGSSVKRMRRARSAWFGIAPNRTKAQVLVQKVGTTALPSTRSSWRQRRGILSCQARAVDESRCASERPPGADDVHPACN